MNYDYLPASNGSGDAALMHVESARLTGSTTIEVDVTTNANTKFIGTYGKLGSDGLITADSGRNFRGHLSSGNIIIDAFEPGSTDDGNDEGDVVIIKPNTGWVNRVAQHIMNVAGLGTPEAGTFAALTAAATTLASLVVNGVAHITGNTTVDGNLIVGGTIRTGSLILTTADGSHLITPTKNVNTVTALDHAATVALPSFTAYEGAPCVLRIYGAASETLAFNAAYENISGVDLPTATVAGKWHTFGMMYNLTTTTWQILSIGAEA